MTGLDAALFAAATDLARHTPWLNGPVEVWTNLGLGVFAVLMLVAWWRARRADSVTMTAALVAPVGVLAAFGVAEVLKRVVGELRPCRGITGAYVVEACPPRNDYSFPSGHTTTAFAVVVALLVVDRRLAAVALLFALLEGVSRVYLGAHYPHDVLGSAVVALVAGPVVVVLRRAGEPLTARLRRGRLRPLVGAGPLAGRPTAAAAAGPQRT